MIVWGITAGIFVCLGVLFCFSKKEEGKVFDRMGMYLYKKVTGKGIAALKIKKKEGQVRQILIGLHPGQSPDCLVAEYYAGKIGVLLMIVSAGCLVACGAQWQAFKTAGIVSKGIIRRGEQKAEVVLEVSSEGRKIPGGEIVLEVEPRILLPYEAEEMCERLILRLDEIIPGKNSGLNEVQQDLYLPDAVEGYPFLIEWSSSDSEVVDIDGNVFAEQLEKPAVVTLRGEISYGENVWSYNREVTVYPPFRSEEETLLFEIKNQTEDAMESNPHEEMISLPDKVNGQRIEWKEKRNSPGESILLLVLAAAFGVYFMKDRDLKAELNKRRKALKAEYPQMVSRYMLLLSAGMTVRGAFFRICKDYEEGATGKKGKHPLCEEMSYACNELRIGISESRVYEAFGQRTGIPEYARLSTLLNQNLKKGNSALIGRLKQECHGAMAENIQYQKRLGEEAGTKLLIPMSMLLIMILVMIILPAFSGLGI